MVDEIVPNRIVENNEISLRQKTLMAHFTSAEKEQVEEQCEKKWFWNPSKGDWDYEGSPLPGENVYYDVWVGHQNPPALDFMMMQEFEREAYNLRIVYANRNLKRSDSCEAVFNFNTSEEMEKKKDENEKDEENKDSWRDSSRVKPLSLKELYRRQSNTVGLNGRIVRKTWLQIFGITALLNLLLRNKFEIPDERFQTGKKIYNLERTPTPLFEENWRNSQVEAQKRKERRLFGRMFRREESEEERDMWGRLIDIVQESPLYGRFRYLTRKWWCFGEEEDRLPDRMGDNDRQKNA